MGGGISGGKVILCLGDSLTNGTFSFNWIRALEKSSEYKDYTFINAGVNGDLTGHLLNRAKKISPIYADKIIIWIGTNDVKALLKDRITTIWMWKNNIRQKPSIDGALKNVTNLIVHLRKLSFGSIAIVSIPPLGENLSTEANKLVEAYNKGLYALSIQHKIQYLKFHERIIEELQGETSNTPFHYDAKIKIVSFIRRFLLFKSWDKISEMNQYKILVDGVHLNEKAGKILLRLLNPFLNA